MLEQRISSLITYCKDKSPETATVSRQIWSKNLEWGVFGVAGTLAPAIFAAEKVGNSWHWNNSPDTLLYGLVYHTGDAPNGAQITLLADWALRKTTKLPTIPRRIISGGVGTGLILYAESGTQPRPIFGVPVKADIPAGLIGVGAALVVASVVNRLAHRRNSNACKE